MADPSRLHDHAPCCIIMQHGNEVAVAGASGYAGGELLRLVLGHPDLTLGFRWRQGASAGAPVTALHPHLPQLAGTSFVATTAAALADADLVFLALPHGESAALVAGLAGHQVVVDLGADFRLTDPAGWGTYDGGAARRQLALRACPSWQAPASNWPGPAGSRTQAATPPP